MKKSIRTSLARIGLSLLPVFLSSVSFANAVEFNHESLRAQSLILPEANVSVTVLYPGDLLSGVCGIEIWVKPSPETGQRPPIERLLRLLRIRGMDPIRVVTDGRSVATIDLARSHNKYITRVSIATADGSSLRNTIRRAYGNSDVQILPGICRDLDRTTPNRPTLSGRSGR